MPEPNRSEADPKSRSQVLQVLSRNVTTMERKMSLEVLAQYCLILFNMFHVFYDSYDMSYDIFYDRYQHRSIEKPAMNGGEQCHGARDPRDPDLNRGLETCKDTQGLARTRKDLDDLDLETPRQRRTLSPVEVTFNNARPGHGRCMPLQHI